MHGWILKYYSGVFKRELQPRATVGEHLQSSVDYTIDMIEWKDHGSNHVLNPINFIAFVYHVLYLFALLFCLIAISTRDWFTKTRNVRNRKLALKWIYKSDFSRWVVQRKCFISLFDLVDVVIVYNIIVINFVTLLCISIIYELLILTENTEPV